MRKNGIRVHDLWRTHLDPRDPDYLDPNEAEDDEDHEQPDMSDDDMDRAASEAENSWRGV